MTVQNELLEILVCPACKGTLVQVRSMEASSGASAEDAPLLALDCPQCRLRYPIVDDIPAMLVDQAQPIPS